MSETTVEGETGADPAIAGRTRISRTPTYEPLSLLLRAGRPLAVELRLEGGRAVWVLQHLESESVAELAGEDGASILIQVPGPDGAWRTGARLHPETGSSHFGLRSADHSRRYVFLGQLELELAAEAVAARGGGVWKLAEARHSHLGDVAPIMRLAGGYELGLVPGETLTLTYETAAVGDDAIADCFVRVSPAGTTAGTANRRRSPREAPAARPTSFALHQNHPNPFARTTAIRFDLAAEREVRLAVFDAQGRRVRTLATGPWPAGFHALEWDRRDDAGREVDPGVYLYRLEAGTFRARRKTVLLP